MLVTVIGICVFAALFLAGLFIAATLSKCTNVQANVFVWPTRVACDAAHPGISAVVDGILTHDGLEDSISPEGVRLLEDLARKMGAEQVVCALHQLIEGYSIPPGIAPPEYEARRARAQKFLLDHGIEVEL